MLGNLVGSWIAYAVGYYGRLDLLEKNRLIHISPKHLDWADGWFERHGDATVFFARMLPIVRTFISLPAGVAKMPFWRFTWLTAARLASPGSSASGADRPGGRRQLGAVAPPPPGYLDYLVVAAIVGLVVYLLIRRRRGPAAPSRPEPAGSSGA